MKQMKLLQLAEEIRDMKRIRPTTYDNWLKALKPLEDREFSDITKVDVRKYIQHNRQPLGPWADSTLLTRMNSLKGLWNFAIDWDYVEFQANPWKNARKLANISTKCQKRKCAYHPWEFYADFHNDPYFVCMWYTGARIGELAGIYKSNIILDTSIPYFNFEHQENRLLKNDESIRQVPIHPACMPYAEHLFFSKAKTPGRAWSERFKKQLGLPPWEAAHSIRHNITTRFNRAGVLERVQDAILGHASPGHGAGYGEIPMDTKLEALQKLR